MSTLELTFSVVLVVLDTLSVTAVEEVTADLADRDAVAEAVIEAEVL